MTTPTKTPAATPSRGKTSTRNVVHEVNCPHCKKVFGATVDPTQPPRLQGSKCPNCKLFVPARLIPGRAPVSELKAPLTKEERQRRG